jgi:hypothetical protein
MSIIKQLVPAVAIREGAGVTVHRSIGTAPLKNLDPFLLLDHFSSDNPDDYIAGFPDHPHRGFITFTYMLDGYMQHRDSMGNEGNLQAGGAQWMKAASGVIHSEMPKQTSGLMRGFQLWINLPARQKMDAPAYEEFSTSAFPVVERDGVKVKVLLGKYEGQQAPIEDHETEVQYLDVSLQAGKTFSCVLARGTQGFIYVFEGNVLLAGTELATHRLAVLADVVAITVQVCDQQARFLIVSGRPLRESIVQYGPFVMNTREEIEQAFLDYREGKLVTEKAEFVGD